MSGQEDNLKIVSPPPAAEDDVISLKLLDLGKTISSWKSYSFGNDFMNANTSWTFEVADDNVFNLIGNVQNGQRIAVLVNGAVAATGYLDQITVDSSAHSGTVLHLRGRDGLGPMCDACMDPKFNFDGLETPKAILEKLSKPFGFTSVEPQHFENVGKLTTASTVLGVDEAGKKIVEKHITAPMNSKLKPHPGEGIYAFCERLGRRFGYHIWSSVDAKTLIVGSPTFNSKPLYRIVHGNQPHSDNPYNLAIDSEMVVDWTQQPSAIVAEGHGGGGHFKKQAIAALMVNELIHEFDNNEIKALKKQYKEAKVITKKINAKKPPFVITPSFIKPMFVHDDSSFDIKQLSNFVRRLMADHQSQFLTIRYTVNRHSQSYQGNKYVWAPNTMVTVIDSVNNIKQDMWIKSRTFTKDRTGGTKTTIECILPYTLELSPSNE